MSLWFATLHRESWMMPLAPMGKWSPWWAQPRKAEMSCCAGMAESLSVETTGTEQTPTSWWWLTTLMEAFSPATEEVAEELGEESCYGYEWEGDKGYPLEEVNGWAKRLVEAHWPGGDEVPMPETLAVSIPTTEAAWRAWRTAMITSHDDRSIADPIFVAIYKEHNHAG